MPDSKVTSFVELNAAPAETDMVYIIDDATGTPISKKITVANLLGSAKAIKTASYSSDQTLTATECQGHTVYVTGAAAITLPAIALGSNVTIFTIGAVEISVNPNTNDKIVLDGRVLNDGNKITNLSTAGDIAALTYYSADGWYASTNGWSEFSNTLIPTYTLDNPSAYGTGGGDGFGSSVSISDTYTIVGAPGEDEAGENSNSGKAYIFTNSTGLLLHTLDNPNAYDTSEEDQFGYSVAISDTYTIVGAYQEDEADNDDSGKAYIYNTVTGTLLHTLNNPNAYSTSDSDQFGYSVAISDTYSVVGAYQEDDAGGSSSGKAYIFTNSTGALLHTLDNPTDYGTSGGDRFGYSVAISDTYTIVGAYYEDDASGLSSGKAYIFTNSTGLLLHTLDNPNAYSTGTNDYFGRSVSISDTYSIVGAYQEDDSGGLSSGKAYIFTNSTGALLHTLDNPNAYNTSVNDYFGSSVFISDTYSIVGVSSEDDDGGDSSGKAYIFTNSTGALFHILYNPNVYSTSGGDDFGSSVAISDARVIVGASGEDDVGGSGSGKAYIYQL